MKVLICGYGSVGQFAVDMLARAGIDGLEIHILSRKLEEDVLPRLNTSIISAMIMESTVPIVYHPCAMDHVEEIERVLDEVVPDIVAYTGRFISNVKYGSYSYPNGIGYGVWTPLSLPLVLNLMKAVKNRGVPCKVIDTSHPDIVDPLLKTLGHQVFTGLGNVNHMVPRIKRFIRMSGRYPEDAEIGVRLICSHYLNTYACRDGKDNGSPYFLRYYIDGEPRFEFTCGELIEACHIPMVSNATRNLMIASDVVEVVRILCGDSPKAIHLPGPNGLIGGYPCIVHPYRETDEVELDLPEEVELEQAIEINRISSQYDGVEDISDGCVTFMDKDIKRLKEVFGIDYPKKIHAEECYAFAKKLAVTLAGF